MDSLDSLDKKLKKLASSKIQEEKFRYIQMVYHRLIVELIDQVTKDWGPQFPELIDTVDHIGFIDALILQLNSSDHRLISIEAAVLDYIILPVESYHSLSADIQKKIINKDEITLFFPKLIGVSVH